MVLPLATMVSVFALAALSAPSSFILLSLARTRTGEKSLGSLELCLLGLLFITLGDGTNLALGVNSAFGRLMLRDPRIDYLILLAVFLASAMMAAFMASFAYQCRGASPGKGARALFLALSVLAFFLAASLPLFIQGSPGLRLERGYSATTIYIAAVQAFAAWAIFRRRKELLGPYRGSLPWINVGLLALGLLCAANGIFHVLELEGGGDLMFSPFFLLLFSVSVNVLCLRFLRSASAAEPSALPDLGLSTRESEILPLILEGLSNEEIGEKLFISSHTVKNHITSIFQKAGVSSRLGLLKLVSTSQVVEKRS